MRLSIIAGTGVDEMDWFQSERVERVDTRFGSADVLNGRADGHDIVLLPRHGLDHSVPPALINYRAQIAALKKLGADRVIGVCAVGSLKPELPAGSFAVLDDFIDLTKRRRDTFFDEPGARVVHTDFTHPYCMGVSEALREACAQLGLRHEPRAVYVGVEGPRYESPAEIRLYASWGGHVVGMTNLPEALLAREAGLCYGAVAVVSNLACGLSPTLLTHDDVRAAVQAAVPRLRDVLRLAIRAIPADSNCECPSNTGLVL